ncbi:MAG: hypothetical protein AAGH79_00895 [Bacteroidota bacterium]
MISKAPIWCLVLGCLFFQMACKKEATFVPDEQLPGDPFTLRGTLVLDDQETPFNWTVGIDSGIVAASLAGSFDNERAYVQSHIGYVDWNSFTTGSNSWTPQPGAGISLLFLYPTSIDFTNRTSWSKSELEEILQEGTYPIGDGPGNVSVLVNEAIGFASDTQDTQVQTLPVNTWSGSMPAFGELQVHSKQAYSWTAPNGTLHNGYLADISFFCPLVDLITGGFGPTAELQDCQGRFLFEYQE